ncbi:ornithine cyclodeaminase family protein [Halapricum hydrolyticum]|uniref:Alanine dehydrogenase n=1 Tax=Halapricum hydrolyticum TaxID=2979991 RepID=A0AAE3IB99_9EURY|nr:ornithine cyclodeaminase family protein [Halapricum hydrolyticum]MCU4717823.1 ornithine cyclodeaminase family protein [Halapricum hydrolyticum]MCU4726987.1 ornithine cyclodeaminase family protein [Halapricum hydrolyticum]
MQTRLLPAEVVTEHTGVAEVVEAVADAFAADARGDAQMPAKSYIDLPQYNGDFRSMPAYLDAGEWDAAAVKWVNVHPDNELQFGLPTVMGTIVYSDPETAFPLALMDGTTITRLRTGAAAAVATRELAREDAASLGLVGAGTQAHTQLEAIATVRDIEEVVVADADPEAVEEFVAAFADRFDVRGGTIEEATRCDVVSTTTPVEEPIVESVGPETHVNAIGADAAGKHEIADDVLEAATIVIDDYEQCTHSGEINVPWSEGLLDDADIYAELGEIVAGRIPGRDDPDGPEGVTIFDSTGLAIQDVAAAHVAYEHAEEADAGTPFDLVGTEI